MPRSASPTEIVNFWFSERVQPLWFDSTPEFDNELRETFLEVYELAARGELQDWSESAEGALALVIILDQLPLNMFRGLPQAFATEAQARRIAAQAVSAGLDTQLPPMQRAFLYMPFMHSEDIDDQNKSVELFERAEMSGNLRWARHHRDLILRYGRFPHRNAILGRVSTPEELTYLESEEAFRG